MGTTGLGVLSVSGRSRVPCPPASRIAFMITTDLSRMQADPLMNLPNALTLVRMFLVPLLVVVLLTEFEGRQILGISKDIVGAAIFALASLTDWLDGYIARRRRQVTWFGQMLDPIADKLLTSAAFISLVQLDLAPAWMVALIIGREFAITGLRSLAYTKGITMPASWLGKIKMVSQVVAILMVLVGWAGVPWLA